MQCQLTLIRLVLTMHFNPKAIPSNYTNYSYHIIKALINQNLFNQSYQPISCHYVLNSLGCRHTHIHKHIHTHASTHTDFTDKRNLRNQAQASLWPAHLVQKLTTTLCHILTVINYQVTQLQSSVVKLKATLLTTRVGGAILQKKYTYNQEC